MADKDWHSTKEDAPWKSLNRTDDTEWVHPEDPPLDPSHPCHFIDLWINIKRVFGATLAECLYTLHVEIPEVAEIGGLLIRHCK